MRKDSFQILSESEAPLLLGCVLFLFLYGLGVSFLPMVTWQTILIIEAPLLLVTFIILYKSFRSKTISETTVRIATACVALIGFSFASYLAFTWASGDFPVCSTGGCAAAQYSKGADIFFGIRTTTVGMVGYVLVLLSLLLPGNLGKMATFFLGTFGFATSVYLTYYSVTELNTTCQWCLGSASAMTIIFALSCWRLFRFIK